MKDRMQGLTTSTPTRMHRDCSPQPTENSSMSVNGHHVVLQIDYMANLRMPLTNLSYSFYKRILGMYGYIITKKQMTTIDMYDETVAQKGFQSYTSTLVTS